MWTAYDFSDPEPKVEKFAVRIPKEDYDRFYKEYEKAIDFNHKVPPMGSELDRDRSLEIQEKERNDEREKKRKEQQAAEKEVEKKE